MNPTLIDGCRQARHPGVIAPLDGVADLGLLLVSGPDVVPFLQAQVTNDVSNLMPGRGHLSARLDRKGALLNWFSLHRLPDRGQPWPGFFLLGPCGQTEQLQAQLQDRVISENVQIENLTDHYEGLTIQGPRAWDVLRDSGYTSAGLTANTACEGDLSELRLETGASAGWICVRSLLGQTGLVVFRTVGAHTASEDPIWSAAAHHNLVSLSNTDIDQQIWASLRVEAGWPAPGSEYTPGRTLLAQTGLTESVVSRSKGCYLGQEIVARIDARGAAVKALRGVLLREIPSLTSLPSPGTAIRNSDGQQLGTWASSGWSIIHDCPVALALLNPTHNQPGSVAVELQSKSIQAQVVDLPLLKTEPAATIAQRLHDRAADCFTAGRDAEAIGLLEEAISVDPTSTDAYESLGVILGKAGRYDEAIDLFKQMGQLAPDDPMVHTNLSLYHMKRGDIAEAEFHKAEATRKRFAELAPADAPTNQAHANKVELERRQAMYAEVLEIDPQDKLALKGLQDVEKALKGLA